MFGSNLCTNHRVTLQWFVAAGVHVRSVKGYDVNLIPPSAAAAVEDAVN